MALLREQVVVGPRLAHELKGARVEPCHDRVSVAARGGNIVSVDCCGLASAYGCNMANCRYQASIKLLPAAGPVFCTEKVNK